MLVLTLPVNLTVVPALTEFLDILRVTTHGVLTMTPVSAIFACIMAVLTISLE